MAKFIKTTKKVIDPKNKYFPGYCKKCGDGLIEQQSDKYPWICKTCGTAHGKWANTSFTTITDKKRIDVIRATYATVLRHL